MTVEGLDTVYRSNGRGIHIASEWMSLYDNVFIVLEVTVKGLYILASDLFLYPLYETLLEIYEDLEYEMYGEIMSHYRDMKETYYRVRGIFNA